LGHLFPMVRSLRVLRNRYQSIKDQINPPLNAFHHLSASALAGFLTCLLTNPLWVIRTRMFAKDQMVYRHVFRNENLTLNQLDGLNVTWKTEGVQGLYRGIVPALWGVSHGAVQFMVYEELKHWRANSHRDLDTQVLFSSRLILAECAGIHGHGHCF
jgi:hypothetical protein